MPSPSVPSRSATVSGRALATLVAVAAVLIAAFVVAPPWLAASSSGGFADRRQLTEAVRKAFVEYWRSGSRDYSPDLRTVVE